MEGFGEVRLALDKGKHKITIKKKGTRFNPLNCYHSIPSDKTQWGFTVEGETDFQLDPGGPKKPPFLRRQTTKETQLELRRGECGCVCVRGR